MSKKKSYMDKNNILSEGFFDKIAKVLGISKNKIKKDPKLNNQVKKLNQSVSDLEKSIKKAWGSSIKLNKFKVDDFK